MKVYLQSDQIFFYRYINFLNKNFPNTKIIFCTFERLSYLFQSDKTKVIVPVHYAGVACEMDVIMSIAEEHKLFVVEDAAQGMMGKYNGRPLGTIGHIGAYSFHETKNIQCGEGGLLAVNNSKHKTRAEIIWEKGTNRSAFFIYG